MVGRTIIYLVPGMYDDKFLCALLEPQSRLVDNILKFQVVCLQNGTAVLKGLPTKNSYVRVLRMTALKRQGKKLMLPSLTVLGLQSRFGDKLPPGI